MGRSITYDAIGNPRNYYNGTAYTFTWQGRQMKTATVAGKTMSFTYNDEGIRTSKTVNGVTTTYYLNGSRIIGEATSEYLILYLYDAEGSPIGMEYYSIADDTWQTYLYEKNLQGDIVSVYTESALRLVTYTYDAWGYFTTTYYNGGANTPAAKNPFTYRGYYFDRDLGLYYLNSRYYDSVICRFINADAIADGFAGIFAFNIYVYVANNPINNVDYSGMSIFKSAVKWLNREVIKPAAKFAKKIISKKSDTVSGGINFNGSLGGVSFDLQIALSLDTQGNLALQGTFASNFGTGTPGFSASATATHTNAPSVDNLEGFGVQTGASSGTMIGPMPMIASISMLIIPANGNSQPYFGNSVGVGFGTPGKEFFVGMSDTVTFCKMNLFDHFFALLDEIEKW